MTQLERRSITIDDDENDRLHAAWSRSGKRLFVSVSGHNYETPRSIELRPEQVEQLVQFLTETLASDPGER